MGTFRAHQAFDPATNTWQRLPPLPTPRHGLAVAEVGGRLYAVSGANVPGGTGLHAELRTADVYTPSAP